jgi:hypothetical protein
VQPSFDTKFLQGAARRKPACGSQRLAKKICFPAEPQGCRIIFPARLEDRMRVWARNAALRTKAEVCTGLPHGALAIDVPFCYIFSV